MKLLVSTVFYGAEAAAYASHLSMMYRIGKTFGDWDFMSYIPTRLPIDTARNDAIKVALQKECDYLFFYDDDQVLYPDTLKLLVERSQEHDLDVVGALNFVRGAPYNPMIFMKREDGNLSIVEEYKDLVDKDGLIFCEGLGMSCTLIRMEKVRRMPAPYFMTGPLNTEDIYFCVKLKRYTDARIAVDTRLPLGHTMSPPILSVKNRDFLKKYNDEVYGVDEQLIPTLKEMDEWRDA